MDWNARILEQFTWHWQQQARPRLDGLTDEEYLWEPAPNSWSIRPGGIDWAYPEPQPAPVTTIAWRFGHLLVGVFGARVASHFGGPPVDHQSYDYPTTATDALARLDEVVGSWVDGVQHLDEQAWARPVGEAEGPWAAEPMVTLVLHIHREAIHHLAEIALLRDLWAHRGR